MTYVEKILRMQAEVAAELQPEADEALTVYHWSARVRPEDGTQDAETETEPGTAEALSLPADMQTPDRPGKADGAEPLLRELRRLEDAQQRAALLTTQTEGERQLRTLQQMQSVQPSAQAGSAFSGGLIGRLTQTLETEGVSSIQAQRSMGEISRFFERDARRYGG